MLGQQLQIYMLSNFFEEKNWVRTGGEKLHLYMASNKSELAHIHCQWLISQNKSFNTWSNSICTDQTALMCSLVSEYAVRVLECVRHKGVFQV